MLFHSSHLKNNKAVLLPKEETNMEDERREAAIPALRPNFKSASVTSYQLNKFKELHRRRLQIKSRSKNQNNLKVNICRAVEPHTKEHSAKASKDEDTSTILFEDSNVSTLNENHAEDITSLLNDKIPGSLAPKKRQKLHWGLDTKERWERKANM